MIEHLAWDTDFFGWKTGSVLCQDSNIVRDILDNAMSEEYKLLYFFTDQELKLSEDLLRKYNGKLVDQKVVFKKELNKYQPEVTEGVSHYDSTDTDKQLLTLAYLSGTYSRFKLDQKFQSNEFEKMYELWMNRSVSHEIADFVFITKSENHINGMVTLKIKEKTAHIGLIATMTEFQGQGLGKKLLAQCQNVSLLEGCESVVVPTQLDNKQACQFYESCGFIIDDIKYIYHFWL